MAVTNVQAMPLRATGRLAAAAAGAAASRAAVHSQEPSLNVWPMPSSLSVGTHTARVHVSSSLAFRCQTQACTNSQLLQRAFQRYKSLMFTHGSGHGGQGDITYVDVGVNTSMSPEQIDYGTDESYTLSLKQGSPSVSLSAANVFGIVRALETLSQLVHYVGSLDAYVIDHAELSITDAPRFPWRGFMIDTSRHYLSVATIKRQIDAASYTKLNTLHWHIVDAISWPYQSKAYPELSKAGAWTPEQVYTQAQIQDIVSYANDRGVRVVPEFDIPGHTAVGMAFPHLAACADHVNVNNDALDPTQDATYTFLSTLLSEVAALFPDSYLHLGGDEVDLNCWSSNEGIVQWLHAHHMNVSELQHYFWTRFFKEVYPSIAHKKVVLWEYTDMAIPPELMPAGTMADIWADRDVQAPFLQRGVETLFSGYYYLDQMDPAHIHYYQFETTWQTFYSQDPVTGLNVTAEQAALVRGGEACQWAEQVDDVSIDTRAWPRAAASAERFWSPITVTDLVSAKARLMWFVCHLQSRGIAASPIEPDNCPARLL